MSYGAASLFADLTAVFYTCNPLKYRLRCTIISYFQAFITPHGLKTNPMKIQDWKAGTFICHGFLFCLVYLMFLVPIQSQDKEISATDHALSGRVLLTHNGLSLIPSFSLDKPAAIFFLSAGQRQFTFEPEMRFALEGKPWSFIFWFRYKAIQHDKFSLRIGGHQALNFRTLPVVANGQSKEVIDARRFLATEIAPNLKLHKYFSVGMYYLYALGLDDSQRHAHFVVLSTSFPDLPIYNTIRFSLFPNVYYLALDDINGYYFSSSFKLSKVNFPLWLESIINVKLRSDIQPERYFVWNISLVYSF